MGFISGPHLAYILDCFPVVSIPSDVICTKGGETDDLHGWGIYSLAPGRCGSNFKSIIFKLIIQNSNLGTFCEIALRWIPQNFINEKSKFAR